MYRTIRTFIAFYLNLFHFNLNCFIFTALSLILIIAYSITIFTIIVLKICYHSRHLQHFLYHQLWKILFYSLNERLGLKYSTVAPEASIESLYLSARKYYWRTSSNALNFDWFTVLSVSFVTEWLLWFWLVHCILCVLCDWLEWLLWFWLVHCIVCVFMIS